MLAPLVITRAAIAQLRAHGGGSIVNISSGAATTGAPHTYIPYAMSKAALNLLTVGAAKEFAADGVRVNTVSPGHDLHRDPRRRPAVRTRPRSGRPGCRWVGPPTRRRSSGAVAYLLSDDASYTNGADIRITGG